MEYKYRNEEVQLTKGQVTSFLMSMLPYGDDQVPGTAIMDAAFEADFFQLSGKQDQPAFVFPLLTGISKAEVDRRMDDLIEEIVESVNEAMQATAVKVWREEDEARPAKEFVSGKAGFSGELEAKKTGGSAE